MRIIDLTKGEATFFLLEKKCFHCKRRTEFSLSFDQYNRYIVNREYAQDVFPDLTPENREMIISGTHPECWNAMFPVNEEMESRMRIPNDCSCNTQMHLQGKVCDDCLMNENSIEAILKAFDGQVFANNDEKHWFAVNACLRFIKFKFEQDEMFGHISLEEHETIEEALGQLWAKNFWSSIFSSKTRTNEVTE